MASIHKSLSFLLIFLIRPSKAWQPRIRLFSLTQRLTTNNNARYARRLPRRRSQHEGEENSEKSSSINKSIRQGVSGIVSRIRRPPSAVERITQLERENTRLRQTIDKLEDEKERLEFEAYNRIVLETFEGEGRLRRFKLGHDDDSMTLTGEEMLSDDSTLWCDELEEGACPVEPTISFRAALRDRAYWLVGLLILQSCSGIILARNESLLSNHPVIVYFLTMLVGAGGNAGNQASVRVIRGLALGTLNERTQGQFLSREVKMAFALSSILSLAGFLRAAAFRTPFPETIAVTSALALIVFTSICLGAVLPLILKRLGVDPAHSSTTIQVIMDILGVLLAVVVSSLLLDSPFGAFLVAKLTGTG